MGLLVLANLALAGCDSDLPQATEIERMRVLGARLEVLGDEGRATPKPGEALRITLPTVFPSLAADVSRVRSMIIGCTGPDRYTGGLPLCQEIVDAALEQGDLSGALPMVGSGRADCDDIERQLDDRPVPRFQIGAVSLQCLSGEPVAEMSVPRGFEADEMLMLGVVCEQGVPYLDPREPELFGCDGEGEAIPVHGLIPIQHEAPDENLNPRLDGLLLWREGVRWEEYEPSELPPEEHCYDMADPDPDFDRPVHEVVPGAHRIRILYDEGARERVDGEPEDLEFTIHVTAGEMERRFTLFEGDDDGGDNGLLESELDWGPPAPQALPAGGAGLLVRFFVTVRDQRGGFALTRRAVCVR